MYSYFPTSGMESFYIGVKSLKKTTQKSISHYLVKIFLMMSDYLLGFTLVILHIL